MSYGVPKHTFAILIPAHNEENSISATLQSCGELNYPKEKYKVFVIADNCTDRTADIVRQNGATCFERFDEEKKGKGFALEWGFKQILPEGYDALVVLDADCQLANHALRIFDNYLKKGEKVLQANDAASNPDSNAMSYAVAIGNLIENRLFYAPKSKLGLAVFLRGTGMVFRREILEKHPWNTHSVVEDVEYTLRLIKNGIKVNFVNEVKVSSEFPATKDQLRVQRERWAGRRVEVPVIAFSRGYTAENKKVAFYEWLERRALKRVNGIIFVSEGQKKRLGDFGIRGKRIWVFRNAISVNSLKHLPVQNPWLQQLNHPLVKKYQAG